MSQSTFHQHFHEITSLWPLQFVKQLRLIEAWWLMFSEGAAESDAAYSVGYESFPQSTGNIGDCLACPRFAIWRPRRNGQSPPREDAGLATKFGVETTWYNFRCWARLFWRVRGSTSN